MTNDVMAKIKGPAIGLLIAGILKAACSLLALAGGVFRLSGIVPETLPSDDVERFGFIIGTVVTYGICLISLLVSPFVIYGAVQMMKGQKRGAAKAAAILTMVPLTSCCFIVGIPIGIWAFVVLNKPDVRDFFDGRWSGNMFPPNPPRSW